MATALIYLLGEATSGSTWKHASETRTCEQCISNSNLLLWLRVQPSRWPWGCCAWGAHARCDHVIHASILLGCSAWIPCIVHAPTNARPWVGVTYTDVMHWVYSSVQRIDEQYLDTSIAAAYIHGWHTCMSCVGEMS